MKVFLATVLLLYATPLCPSLIALDYKVEIDGVSDKKIVNSLKENSQTVALRLKKPVATFQALRKRADGDIKKFHEVCRFYGYHNPEIDFTIIRSIISTVKFKIDLGPRFVIKNVKILPTGTEFTSGKPASTNEILSLEQQILTDYKAKGFAFCKVTKKDIIADIANQSVSITLWLDQGPEVLFGKTTISGNTTVKAATIQKHIDWHEGELYNPEQVERTLQRLEKSGLFSSVVVDESPEKIEGNKLPIDLRLQEAKHKTLGAGVSYTTSKGPGVNCKWENRNFRGREEKLAFQAEIWKDFQNAKLSLRQPHFGNYHQDRLWQLEFDRQDTLAYLSEAYSASSILERRLSSRSDVFWGGKLESLRSKSFNRTATYYLVKAPLGFKWNHVKNPLDPLYGQSLSIRLTPAYQCMAPRFGYVTHTTTGICYHSFFHDKLTLAAKATFGNIFGAAEYTIPTPDRFFSGTENALRGYKYLTVSPYHDDKPIGGRSMLTGSIEARLRTDSGFGWVTFYDIGNVYRANFPLLKKGFLQSIGVGARYATPIGPLRLDFAVPLDRRRKIDPPFQIYFSIGHAF